ncbi:MAG: DUF3102 domain-containing protein [Betaproteobacteria bacterium]|nr:DUF3102 domain-containing protein [Betaproteobacteria bacterium]MCL2886524.1 DUF3102 domain-containing protein [Betaproteobacteria bacterium]
MARKPNPQTPPTEPIDLPGLPAVVDGLNQLAVYDNQREATVRAVADRLGYQLPADCADADLIQRDIASNMRRTAEAMLEVGRGLICLKEACEHGEFMARLEVLRFEQRVANRYMQVARRASKWTTSSTLLKVADSQSKLLELIVLDDEEIEELALTGQTGELALDDIATMSVKELRKALREAKADKEADAELLEKKNARIDKLERDKLMISRLPLDEALALTKKEASAIMADALGLIRGNFRQALRALAGEEGGQNAIFMAGLVGQLAAELATLRDEFDLPDVSTAADVKLAAEVAQWGG